MIDKEFLLAGLRTEVEAFCEALRDMLPESLDDALHNSMVFGDVFDVRLALVEWHEGSYINLGLYATTGKPKETAAHGDQ